MQRRHHLAFADLIFTDSISQFLESHHDISQSKLGTWDANERRFAVSAPGLGVRSDSMDGPLQTGSSHTQLTSALHPKWAARKALRKQNTGMLNQL